MSLEGAWSRLTGPGTVKLSGVHRLMSKFEGRTEHRKRNSGGMCDQVVLWVKTRNVLSALLFGTEFIVGEWHDFLQLNQ